MLPVPCRHGRQCLKNIKTILTKQFEAVLSYQPSLGNPHVSLAESRPNLGKKRKNDLEAAIIWGRWASVYVNLSMASPRNVLFMQSGFGVLMSSNQPAPSQPLGCG